MGRFLLYISYIGRNFNGLQRQKPKDGITTIVGALEDALKYVSPASNVNVVTSSRTDKGVHALCNTVHVDLSDSAGGPPLLPEDVTTVVNQNMQLHKHDIRVLQTVRVPDDFHSRFNARSRTYVYRSAFTQRAAAGWTLPYSPFEYMTAYLDHRRPVDIDALHQTAQVLSGTHDFRAFSKPRRLLETPWVNPVKTLEVKVTQGQPFLGHHLPEVATRGITHLEFIFKSNSFLYRQVRKMTAVMLAVGGGQLELDMVRQMLDEPTKDHFSTTSIYDIPSYGLYLKEVEYDPADLLYTPPGGSTELAGGATEETLSETTTLNKDDHQVYS